MVRHDIFNPESNLPVADVLHHAIAIPRLQNCDSIGSTFVERPERYSETLINNGGKYMLYGVTPTAYEQLQVIEMVDHLCDENIIPNSTHLPYSSRKALKEANPWLEITRYEGEPTNSPHSE